MVSGTAAPSSRVRRPVGHKSSSVLVVWPCGSHVCLRRGCSPTHTAAELHLQRQSLYQRLARIEELLGHRPDDARAHEVLVVATCAARVLAARGRSR